jgi:hypothetical protein
METEETKKQTLDLLLETRPDSVPISLPGVIPGTDWAQNPGKYGFSMQDEKKHYENLMTHRVNHLCPPVLISSLPGFSSNGKSTADLVEEIGRFVQVLNRNGILTHMPDSTFLICAASRTEAGAPVSRIARYFYDCDHAGIRRLAENVNNGAAAGPSGEGYTEIR